MANHLTLLLEILNDLESEKLDEFKLHLSKGALKGIEPIPRGRLQKALDASAIAGLMTELYIDQHFIDKHRVRLIDTISTVDPILDRLMSKNTITQENYRHIRSYRTSTQRMRELFDLGGISTLIGKDCLYDVLMELEPLVMEELKDAGVK
ncbi:apoptosis-associated speck-like protein containing a CARD [Clupea harengus]|uniref:Apoptosis-associated speck-like protein containing a CARD n=1 Tax=Clupea harengus TaxID=7950 RepID=A0A6P8F081_CLUHA|nr:apoptosis-associated speck-like protein containing a CARD [Clupea harengus]